VRYCILKIRIHAGVGLLSRSTVTRVYLAWIPVHTSSRAVLGTTSTFEHSAIETIIPTVPSHSLYTPIHNNAFVIGDAAFSLEGADVTLYVAS
jgi:hypothetical protein